MLNGVWILAPALPCTVVESARIGDLYKQYVSEQVEEGKR
jgi:hypothetical protein